jgi:menaquinone-dependent protoporphyrinogen oxidase
MSRPNVLILYATRHGQARKIADRLARGLEAKGANADVLNAAEIEPIFDPERYRAAILVASIHVGKHEPEMVAFARRHRELLERIPSAFVSVSMAEATVEGKDRPVAARAQAALTVSKTLDTFVAQTGWRPKLFRPVAGALLYREYNFFIRFIIKMIARRTGADTDTSKNYEYTDWAAVDRFAAEFELVPREING